MEIVLWLGGLATAAGAIWRWVLPFMRSVLAIHDLVEAQLSPNGGGSLVDKVTRTDEAVTEMKGDMADMKERVAAIESWACPKKSPVTNGVQGG